jgi:hypothetical protein
MSDARMVRLCELWERTSARGTRYFRGFLGDAQVLMFDGGERPHPTRPEETVHVWRLMVQERDPVRRPQARDAGGGGVAASASAPAKPSARPQECRDGWRGSPCVPTARERRAAGSGGRRRPVPRGQPREPRPMTAIATRPRDGEAARRAQGHAPAPQAHPAVAVVDEAHREPTALQGIGRSLRLYDETNAASMPQ